MMLESHQTYQWQAEAVQERKKTKFTCDGLGPRIEQSRGRSQWHSRLKLYCMPNHRHRQGKGSALRREQRDRFVQRSKFAEEGKEEQAASGEGDGFRGSAVMHCDSCLHRGRTRAHWQCATSPRGRVPFLTREIECQNWLRRAVLARFI